MFSSGLGFHHLISSHPSCIHLLSLKKKSRSSSSWLLISYRAIQIFLSHDLAYFHNIYTSRIFTLPPGFGGYYRDDQFEGVEQVCITRPYVNDSGKLFDEMLNNCEEFYQKLGLPYQVVVSVSGALTDAAAKTTLLEALFPATAKYRELASCSNTTDYRSRKLNIKVQQERVP